MSVRGLYRGASAKGVATPTNAPIRIDSSSNTPKYIPAGSGSTEIEIADVSTAQTFTNKTFTGGSHSAPIITGRAVVAVTGSSVALTNPLHAGRVVQLSNLAGCAVTLPAATGSGDVYQVMRVTAATSVGDSFAVANNADYMRGVVHVVAKDDGLLSQFGTLNTGTVATESDTATWNFTTTGICDIGDYIEFVDIAAHVWSVFGFYTVNGAEATPFSAAV